MNQYPTIQASASYSIRMAGFFRCLFSIKTLEERNPMSESQDHLIAKPLFLYLPTLTCFEKAQVH
jgi:hypothetical protein